LWTSQKDFERLSRSLGRPQDKAHVFDPKNAFTLTTRGGPNMVKYAKKVVLNMQKLDIHERQAGKYINFLDIEFQKYMDV
jgi:hypothetical protein